MQLIRGEAATVLRRSAASTDSHGNAVYGAWEGEDVQNVLAQPGATSDLDSSRPEGARIAMTFHFPKAYTASLKGCKVSYGGREYAVVGDPQPYTGANTPGPWDRAAECEACDG